MHSQEGRLLPKKVAAARLGISTRTLDRWLSSDDPPPSCLVGKRRYFLQVDLDRWIDAHRQSETNSAILRHPTEHLIHEPLARVG